MPKPDRFLSRPRVVTLALLAAASAIAAATRRPDLLRSIGAKLTRATRGGTLAAFCEHIKDLPRGQLWRHNQAGDLPAKRPGLIDANAVYQIALANVGRHGFTYTHYPPTPKNLLVVRTANKLGFTINLSAESLGQADEYAALGVPVVTVLPIGTDATVITPKGNMVIVCPASTGNTDCLNCGICQNRHRDAIVGFPAHGTGAERVQAIFFAKDIS